MKKHHFIRKFLIFVIMLFLVHTFACSDEDSEYASVDLSSPENTLDEDLAAPEDQDSDYKTIHYKWDYDDKTWTYDLAIPIDAVEAYRSVYRHPESYYELYSSYISDPSDDEYLRSLAQVFINTTTENDLPKEYAVPLAVSFVQHLDYLPDETFSENDYPKYPLETLYDYGGDCEDSSILLCSLLREMDYGCCLIAFEDHMAVGILGDESMEGFYFEKDGQKYYYIETTNPGWPIGEMPEDYQNEDVRLWVY